METRRLGDSDLQVTPIGLGLAALGRPGYITLDHAADLSGDYEVEAMERHTHAVLDAAWELGIRYFDAARSYGRAEAFLSSWLAARHLSPDDCTIGSKWGYTYTAGWQVSAEKHEVKDHTLPTLNRQLKETIELLGEYLDLYQVHSATLDSGVLERDDVLDRLAESKSSGQLRAVGLTLSGPDSAQTLDRALRIERDGRRLFDTVQPTWNLLEQSLSSILAEAYTAGMGIIVKEALANGRLTSRNDDPSFTNQMTLLRAEADRLGCTIDQLALAAVLDQPWANCVLSGAATVEHLRSNAGALNVRLDDRARSTLGDLAEPVDEYWTKRSHLAWQ